MSTAASSLLLRAVQQSDLHQCQILILQANADPNYQNNVGDSALHVACELDGRLAIVELLLGYNADPNIRRPMSTGGHTPLHVAVRHQNYHIVERLFAGGASPFIPDSRGRIPLHDAAYLGDLEMCKLLIFVGGSPIGVMDSVTGFTPQKIASEQGFNELERYLDSNPRQLKYDDIPLKDDASLWERSLVWHGTVRGP